MGTLVQPLLYKKALFLPQKLPIGGKDGKNPNKICFCLDQNKSIFRLHRTKSIQNKWEKLKTSNRLVKVELQKIKIESHILLNFPVSGNLTHMRMKELSNAQADLRDWSTRSHKNHAYNQLPVLLIGTERKLQKAEVRCMFYIIANMMLSQKKTWLHQDQTWFG